MSGGDKKVALTCIQDLLEASTEDEFEEILMGKSCWDQNFAKYFDRFLLADVRHSSKFTTEKLGIYYPVAGVSNNVRYTRHSYVIIMIIDQTFIN